MVIGLVVDGLRSTPQRSSLELRFNWCTPSPMAKLRLIVLVGLVACGGNNNAPDAKVVVQDAPPDQKVFLDAPPPMFDTSCIGNSPPTPSATVTIAGNVQEGSLGGIG